MTETIDKSFRLVRFWAFENLYFVFVSCFGFRNWGPARRVGSPEDQFRIWVRSTRLQYSINWSSYELRFSEVQKMVEYMIVTKWWWKKLLEEIKCKLTSFHPVTSSCHSEPFDGLRTGSAKNLCGRSDYEILRRPPSAGLLRMTSKNTVSGCKLAISGKAIFTVSPHRFVKYPG